MAASASGTIVDLPERLLRAVRADEPTDPFLEELFALDAKELEGALDTDPARYAFWLNLYNASVQLALESDPSGLQRRWRFFSRDRVPVAGRQLSLDDIEHGLLRRSQLKFAFGYLQNPFASGFERRFRVEERDPRIHFALNCGAASCPPIAAYEPDGLDDQLELATLGYLEGTVTVDQEAEVVTVPRLFSWYRGDFGGKAGTVEFLKQHGIVGADAAPSVRYAPYDWSLDLGDYR